ncbi:MAG: hypothetical protein KDD29_10960, partial [Flavobacteriales bacterium]|nr:hypothetical protein [Flavobacteriales bacterium]
MRKIYILVFSIFVLGASAQSFYKGALVTEVRTGFELYNAFISTNHSGGNRVYDTVYTDKSANTYFGLGAEYGLHKYVGVGLSFNSHKYITEKDTVTNTRPNSRANNIMAMVNLHPVTTKKFDLVVGADIGYSGFKFSTNDSLDTYVKGTGFCFSGYLNPRIYFGNFGIQFKLSTPFARYGNVMTNNDNFNKNNSYNWIKFSAAWGIGFGIQYRFLKDKSSVKEDTKLND